MSLEPEWLLRLLQELQPGRGVPARYLVAFSGGLDSSVLLHLLAAARAETGVPVEAVHVDHGLQAASDSWAEHARRFADALGIACTVVRAEVGRNQGPEAAARAARYAALEQQMRDGDWLLSAHHRDDQAETLLLNLMRGSGPIGLAAMPPIRPFGPGYLARPFLQTARSELSAYAARAGLQWIEDPSNDDTAFDRNFLRREVLPLLAQRWPDTAARIARSAAHLGDVATLLREIDERSLEAIGAGPDGLPVPGLRALPATRAGGALRRAVELAGLPRIPPAATHEILARMIDARDDANPVVRWPGAECRRYRDRLHLRAELGPPMFEGQGLAPGAPAVLGPAYGELALEAADGPGLDPALLTAGLTLRLRRGGEEITPLGHRHTRKLKKLLQERGVFPWMREVLPLLYSDGRLVAVADLWIAADAAATPGYAVRWHDAPRYA